MVMPGRGPLIHWPPAFVDVAKPMSDAPPLKIRPTWNALTIVEPEEKALASTSVACWLRGVVRVSVLRGVSAMGGGVVVCCGCELDPPPQAVAIIKIPSTVANRRGFRP